jgi:hypothetical protein
MLYTKCGVTLEEGERLVHQDQGGEEEVHGF